ncbi:hypothetical protein EHI8A_021060 [Entamoeba histolytica HM-1:IMSS-B]|uniref:Uncharacterized protein n=5 Tax=Entamoeba histolytica TaxID=5759 RepID=C4M469_ENTH1|nr:hypothetical protein EHI_140200 [Entamoeba histolytica HM-1:IMSS]EMH77297.1 hypothetical protein EHI8A_021060 [Entamoeba histolytica HM-1:IMSS-B]EMS16889.1 hypothetical protein KM1_052910 [Entamoeba histolytica HM-3:IMSS]ENY64410.1 hypothetical protein EHI7A_023420 [Entamoeba histolytica HM-1:IMSS-A]GAT96148.1 hypothetical protein CL6EHI_140200 [Entamoeba histolytica]EAL51363.1 hypothetical protein EHI_140200 [Entamoeba histolytica HM-1:IMSS]|eukprot:XP_656746.1 hypothetical protein EHI_140200 [Entamoeba histolytica HM-1:IMSS]
MGKISQIKTLIDSIQYKKVSKEDFVCLIEQDDGNQIIKNIISSLKTRKFNKRQQIKLLILIFWSLNTQKTEDIAELILKKKFRFSTIKCNKDDIIFISFSKYLDYLVIIYNQFHMTNSNMYDYTPKVLLYFELIIQSWDCLMKIDSLTTTSTINFEEIITTSFYEQCKLYHKTITIFLSIIKRIDSLNLSELEEFVEYIIHAEKMKFCLWKKLKDNEHITQKYGKFMGVSYYQFTPFIEHLKERIILERKHNNSLENLKKIIQFEGFVEQEYLIMANCMLSYIENNMKKRNKSRKIYDY